MLGPSLVLVLAGSLLMAAADRPMQGPTSCLNDMLSACRGDPVQIAAPPSSPWKFTRTQGAREGESYAAIMKTADTARSDPDFAGLIVRCAPQGKVDVLVALVRPFPPQSHPQVTIASSNGGTVTFEASMAAAGAAVLLPDEVSAFAGGQWQTTPSLSLAVKESDSEIKGMVTLNGLRQAYHALLANCSQ